MWVLFFWHWQGASRHHTSLVWCVLLQGCNMNTECILFSKSVCKAIPVLDRQVPHEVVLAFDMLARVSGFITFRWRDDHDILYRAIQANERVNKKEENNYFSARTFLRCFAAICQKDRFTLSGSQAIFFASLAQHRLTALHKFMNIYG